MLQLTRLELVVVLWKLYHRSSIESKQRNRDDSERKRLRGRML